MSVKQTVIWIIQFVIKNEPHKVLKNTLYSKFTKFAFQTKIIIENNGSDLDGCAGELNVENGVQLNS